MKPAGLFYNLLSVEHNVESGGMAHQKTEGNIGTVADPARFEVTTSAFGGQLSRWGLNSTITIGDRARVMP
jgi:hypothetical protein